MIIWCCTHYGVLLSLNNLRYTFEQKVVATKIMMSRMIYDDSNCTTITIYLIRITLMKVPLTNDTT